MIARANEFIKPVYTEPHSEFVDPFPYTWAPTTSMQIWAPGARSEGYALGDFEVPSWSWLLIGLAALILIGLGFRKKEMGLITEDLPEFLGIE